MKAIISRAAIALTAVYYALLKNMKRVDTKKILFLGRHSDQTPLDFRLLEQELRRQEPTIRVVVICKAFEPGGAGTAKFAWAVLRSLHHLATAKVCVLDSYWPAISLFQHRSDLTVYQLWHALGKMKRSGKQSLGLAQGRSPEEAKRFRMHEGYDFFVGGSSYWNEYYREAFGIEEEQILNYGLPRADHLYLRSQELASTIRNDVPELMGKKLVLYVPTFRRGKPTSDRALQLAKAFQNEDVLFTVRPHKDDTALLIPDSAFRVSTSISTLDLLTVTDLVITDYSSIALEAALLTIPTVYFAPDYEEYMSESGMNIDLRAEMPSVVFERASDLAIFAKNEYPVEALENYRKKFLPQQLGAASEHIASHILSEGGLCRP